MSTGVVVPQRLRTTKTLQRWVRRKNHVLDLLDATVLATRHSRDVLHDPFRCFGLACTGLARDDNTLVLMVRVHVIVCRLGDAEDVRRHLQPVFALVLLQGVVCIYPKIYVICE